MSRPEDIPQGVWDDALDIVAGIDADFSWDGFRGYRQAQAEAAAVTAIARATLAERERCAVICDQLADSLKGEPQEYMAYTATVAAERIRA